MFLFEDLPASGRRADQVYLKEVDCCDVYVGLFGNEYGHEDAEGLSPTEREFDRAAAAGKERLIFVKGHKDAARHPKMRALVRKAKAPVDPAAIHHGCRPDQRALRKPGGLPGKRGRNPGPPVRRMPLPGRGDRRH